MKAGGACSEDQLPGHDGFDFKSIEKAMKHNQKSKSLHWGQTTIMPPGGQERFSMCRARETLVNRNGCMDSSYCSSFMIAKGYRGPD